ncbi:MAG: hypothetical protein H5T69_05900, partial [Chloroflexi bacterium]|nr:hypothetical protein [Chloroflexota bacterium]
DAAYISHDIYAVWQSSTVEAGARWGLVDYIRAEPDTESGDRSVAVPDPSAFLGANVPTSFAAQQAEGYEGGPIRAGVEYAVAIWRLGETATLSLAPQHVDALQDEVFGLDLVIESGARPIDSVQAYIDYDPAILQCVTESGQPATALAAGELTMVLQNEIDAAAGEINFAARTPLGQPGRAGRLQVARLFFRTIGVTHPISGTQVEFSWYPPRRTDAFSGVDSVLGQVREATVRSVVPATLRGHVTLQGRPVPPHNRWRIPLMLQLLDPAFGASVQTLAVTTDRTGTFTETVAAGNYTLRVKGMHTLANVRTGVALPPAPANVDLGTLREGDVDNDNDVDAADASLINVAFASVPGSLNWDARADLNEDGVVDATDMALISANYGQSGDVPVGAGLARTGAVTGPVTRSEVKVTPPVAVVFRPSSMDMDPGDEVMIDLVLQAGSAHVDAIDLHILYPTDLVQAINAGGSPATALISTGVLAVEFANSIDSSTGTMHFAGATVGDSLSGEVVLASIRFRARQRVAVGWLRLSMWQPESGVYYQGQPVLGAWPAARVHVMGSERLDLPLIRRR